MKTEDAKTDKSPAPPPPESWWTRFKAWWEEDDTEDPQFGESAYQSIREQVNERVAQENARAKVAVYNSIVQATYVQYVVMHPDEPDVHTKAFQIGIKAADEWQDITKPR